MKILPETFSRDGFTFTQINREGDLAIYRRTKQIGGAIIEHFEVIVIHRHNGFVVNGNKVDPAETYPYNEQWGKFAFTCQDIDAAWVRFRKLRAERVELELALE